MSDDKETKGGGLQSRLDDRAEGEGVEEQRMQAKWQLLQSLKGRKIVDAQAGFWSSENTGEEVMLLLDDNTVLYLSTVQLDQDGEPVPVQDEAGVYMGLEAMREDRDLLWDTEKLMIDKSEADQIAGAVGGDSECDDCGCDDEDCGCDDDDCDCGCVHDHDSHGPERGHQHH